MASCFALHPEQGSKKKLVFREKVGRILRLRVEKCVASLEEESKSWFMVTWNSKHFSQVTLTLVS